MAQWGLLRQNKISLNNVLNKQGAGCEVKGKIVIFLYEWLEAIFKT